MSFNSISVIPEQSQNDNERLSAMESHVQLERIPRLAGFQPESPAQSASA